MRPLSTLLEAAAAVLDDAQLADIVERVDRVHAALAEARVVAARADVVLLMEADDSPDWARHNDWAGQARVNVLERQADVERLRVELEAHARAARVQALAPSEVLEVARA